MKKKRTKKRPMKRSYKYIAANQWTDLNKKIIECRGFLTPQEISEKLGCSVGHVYRVWKKSGITAREVRKETFIKNKEEQFIIKRLSLVDKIIACHGYLIPSSIAKVLDCSVQEIYRVWRINNLPITGEKTHKNENT